MLDILLCVLFICGVVAEKMRRNGFFAGFLLGPIGLLLIGILLCYDVLKEIRDNNTSIERFNASKLKTMAR